MGEKKLEEVKEFWENNPLFSGESDHPPGSKEFFEEHKETYYDDVFAGEFKREKFIPDSVKDAIVLDLGCGVGFWTIEIQQTYPSRVFYSGDLTQTALDITQKRLETYALSAELSLQNAESMTYEDNFFDHVNCQGVIHHTPDTDATIREISRVLKPGGTASISVYYKNFFIRNWKFFSWFGRLLHKRGAKLKGRGRDSIFNQSNTDEITRLYDGDKNPIGKSYTRKQIIAMVAPYFHVEKTFLYFFPARSLPFRVPKWLHRFLDRNFGFMIHLNLVKK
jgi:ubiquinone/menaquinone biosynthesis C-methylase UbiE